jgi:branched-chain amino acid aminotransferase/4-amino-4-deoxychorismate lyase
MKAIYNGQITKESSIMSLSGNRGFCYGDGMFETFAIHQGKIRLLGYHLDRLKNGLDILKLHPPDNFPASIKSFFDLLIRENTITGKARGRVYVWRSKGGLFTPEKQTSEYLITVEPSDFHSTRVCENAGICKSVTNYLSPFSSIKTLSALKYVLAGIEKKDRGLDEIILTDADGHISECLSSNMFIVKDQTFFTPPLSTGCIEGIMRRWIIETLSGSGVEVQEKLFDVQTLLDADHIFSSNVFGIKHIKKIDHKEFEVDTIISVLMEKVDST